jgi:hypothetical protein
VQGRRRQAAPSDGGENERQGDRAIVIAHEVERFEQLPKATHCGLGLLLAREIWHARECDAERIEQYSGSGIIARPVEQFAVGGD